MDLDISFIVLKNESEVFENGLFAKIIRNVRLEAIAKKKKERC